MEGMSLITYVLLVLLKLAPMGQAQPIHAVIGVLIPMGIGVPFFVRHARARWVRRRLSSGTIARDELLGLMADHDPAEGTAESQLGWFQTSFWILGGLLLAIADQLLDAFRALRGNPKFAAWGVAAVAGILWFLGKAVQKLHDSLVERMKLEEEARKLGLGHLQRFAHATLMRKDLAHSDGGWRVSVTDGSRTPRGVAASRAPEETTWEEETRGYGWPVKTLERRGHAAVIALSAACFLEVSGMFSPRAPGLLRGPEIPANMVEHFSIQGIPQATPKMLWMYSERWPQHYVFIHQGGIRSCDNRDVRRPYHNFYQMSWSQVWDMKLVPSAKDGEPTQIIVRSSELQDHVIELPRTPDRRDLKFYEDAHDTWLKNSYWPHDAPNLVRHRDDGLRCPPDLLPFPAVFPERNYPR